MSPRRLTAYSSRPQHTLTQEDDMLTFAFYIDLMGEGEAESAMTTMGVKGGGEDYVSSTAVHSRPTGRVQRSARLRIDLA